MIKAFLNFLLVSASTLFVLTLAPALFISMGSFLLMLGKLVGVLYKGGPFLYMSLSVIISILWGLQAFVRSK